MTSVANDSWRLRTWLFGAWLDNVCVRAKETRRPSRGLIDSAPSPTDRQLKDYAVRRGQTNPARRRGISAAVAADWYGRRRRPRTQSLRYLSKSLRQTDCRRHTQHVVVADQLREPVRPQYLVNRSRLPAHSCPDCNPSTMLARDGGRLVLPEAAVDEYIRHGTSLIERKAAATGGDVAPACRIFAPCRIVFSFCRVIQSLVTKLDPAVWRRAGATTVPRQYLKDS